MENNNEVASFINEYPEFAEDLLSIFNDDITEAKKQAEENYQGCFESLADYAAELMDEVHDIPENIAYYLDYEHMGRDMKLGGDIYTIETGYKEIHIFLNT